MIGILALLFLVLIIMGLPIVFSTGIPVVIYLLLHSEIAMSMLPQKMYTVSNTFSFLAIPLFILAGEFMNSAGLTRLLVDIGKAFVGHIRGSLYHVTILASMLFACMSGSSPAAAASIGSMLIPAMKENGYDEGCSAALVASSAVMGPIIPPSIGFVLYCSITGDSVGKMFMAGILPGICLGLCFMILSYFLAKKQGVPVLDKATWKTRFHSLFKGLPALFMPIIILGGIFSGIFTATEAASIAALYTLIIGIIQKRMTFKGFFNALVNSAKSSSAVLLIVGVSQALGWILTVENIPVIVKNFLLSISTNPTVIFLIMIGIFLVLGCFMVDAAMVTLFIPIMQPIAMSLGINHLQYGVAIIMAAVIGGVTPPVGNLLYISSGVGNVPVGKTIKALPPYLIALIIGVLLCVFIEPLTTFIPSILF